LLPVSNCAPIELAFITNRSKTKRGNPKLVKQLTIASGVPVSA